MSIAGKKNHEGVKRYWQNAKKRALNRNIDSVILPTVVTTLTGKNGFATAIGMSVFNTTIPANPRTKKLLFRAASIPLNLLVMSVHNVLQLSTHVDSNHQTPQRQIYSICLSASRSCNPKAVVAIKRCTTIDTCNRSKTHMYVRHVSQFLRE